MKARGEVAAGCGRGCAASAARRRNPGMSTSTRRCSARKSSTATARKSGRAKYSSRSVRCSWAVTRRAKTAARPPASPSPPSPNCACRSRTVAAMCPSVTSLLRNPANCTLRIMAYAADTQVPVTAPHTNALCNALSRASPVQTADSSGLSTAEYVHCCGAGEEEAFLGPGLGLTDTVLALPGVAGCPNPNPNPSPLLSSIASAAETPADTTPAPKSRMAEAHLLAR
mmetsp:Transcript_12293/g.16875  ORF Transcript_12293/g.16875 Transcript_12293/m.16875 type:complete len:227 (-) Transcript_12293:1072-1752(-)